MAAHFRKLTVLSDPDRYRKLLKSAIKALSKDGTKPDKFVFFTEFTFDDKQKRPLILLGDTPVGVVNDVRQAGAKGFAKGFCFLSPERELVLMPAGKPVRPALVRRILKFANLTSVDVLIGLDKDDDEKADTATGRDDEDEAKELAAEEREKRKNWPDPKSCRHSIGVWDKVKDNLERQISHLASRIAATGDTRAETVANRLNRLSDSLPPIEDGLRALLRAVKDEDDDAIEEAKGDFDGLLRRAAKFLQNKLLALAEANPFTTLTVRAPIARTLKTFKRVAKL